MAPFRSDGPPSHYREHATSILGMVCYLEALGFRLAAGLLPGASSLLDAAEI